MSQAECFLYSDNVCRSNKYTYNCILCLSEEYKKLYKLNYDNQVKLEQPLIKIKELLKQSDFTQCQRCDGCGYAEGCADEDCSTYILHKIREVLDEVDR